MAKQMQRKPDWQRFQRVMTEREIKRLVHFTKFQSIVAIVGEGRILSREDLVKVDYEWRELLDPNCIGERARRDDPGYLCTSIMHPSVDLLEVFRDKWYPDRKFCVVGIQPTYIYESQTVFSISNATYTSSKKFGINNRFETFAAMFHDQLPGKSGTLQYRDPQLQAYFTTDPQAEVRIKSEIPYSDILFIACRNKFEFDLLASAFEVLNLSTEKLRVKPTLFEYRS